MSKKIQAYNFRRPDRISKNQIRSLHFVHERFARNCSSSVSALLRMVVEISLEAIEQVTYGEFVESVSDPTCYCGIRLKPLEGIAVLELSPDAAFPMLDRLLGGAGKPLNTNRVMTEIEVTVIRSVLKVLIENLQEAWRPVYGLEFALGDIEAHPQMLKAVGGGEMVIQHKFQIRLRDTTGTINVVIPTQTVEPVLHIFDQEMHARRKIISDTGLLLHAREVPLRVSVETDDTMMPMRAVLSLKKGDTVVLDQRKELPLVVKVGGRKKMLAAARIDPLKKTFNVIQNVR